MAKTEEWTQPPNRPYLDDAAFYGIMGEMVNYVSAFTEADPALMLPTMVLFAGCLAGRGAAVCPDGISNEPLLINILGIGDSYYGRKDTAVKALTPYMMAADSEFWTKQKKTDATSERGIAEMIRDNSGKKDPETEEEIPDGKDDKRLLLCVGEFEKVIDAMNNPMTKLGPTIRTLYDGTDIHINTNRPVTATKPHVAFHCLVQGEVFAEKYNSTQAAGGTFSRFLPVYTHRSKRYMATKLEAHVAKKLQDYGERFGAIIARFREKYSPEFPHVFSLDVEAQKWWEEELHRHFTTKPSGATTFEVQFISRRASILLRIAAIFALMDEKPDIGVRHVEAALAVIEYSRKTVKHTEEEYGIKQAKLSKTDRDKEKLSEILKRVGAAGVARHVLVDSHFGKRAKDVDFLLEHVPHDYVLRKTPGATKRATYYFAPGMAPVKTPSN